MTGAVRRSYSTGGEGNSPLQGTRGEQSQHSAGAESGQTLAVDVSELLNLSDP